MSDQRPERSRASASGFWFLISGFAFCAFAFLHLYRLGAISPTWDEGGDTSIVDCIQKTRDPFACTADISQTRLPFYIHALAGPAYGSERPHYLVSFVFSALTLGLIFVWSWRRFGPAVAALAAALYVTSPQLLASGRMILTHSNIIFAFFSTVAFVAAMEFAIRAESGRPLTAPPEADVPSPGAGATQSGEWRLLVLCAVFSGLSAASHPLGLFNGIAILAIYLTPRRYAWRDLWFFPIAAATFFATTIIYLSPANFRALVDACLHGGDWPFWNYFGTGSPHAPWWFPLVVFVVKFGPWWIALACAGQALLSVKRLRLLAGERGPSEPGRIRSSVLHAFIAAFFVNLALKGFVFHYEAPHHQVQFYPLLYVAVAVVIVRSWRPSIAVPVVLAFAIQTWDVVRFFPNYLFYGSQYGERFIGEFYGPAVIHAQDKDPLTKEVDRILRLAPDARILVADHNILESNDPRIVPFSKREPDVIYEYAFIDRLYGQHFHFPERDAYNSYLAAHYVPAWTYEFPPHVRMYRLMKRRSP